ncbi:MAG: hypothetical protein KatS3mg105_3511 [Gemmatales bacterium]|nr:MAG: hypothetical protein KatS3mg105_3511 [Gemmatales bacterium]
MRAVSLSDNHVQKILAKEFICATVNLKGNPQAGLSFDHGPNEPARPVPVGLGEHNNQMLVLTPQGEIINARAGYIGPKELLAELDFSLDLLRQLKKAKNRTDAVRKAHQEFLRKSIPGAAPRVQVRVAGAKNVIVKGAGRTTLDHQFVMANPLMPFKDFSIEKMIGKAPRTRFFFGQEVIPARKKNR